MSILDTRQAPRAIADTEPTRLAQTLASSWLTLGLALFAVGQQIAGHLDCDVSWFITFAEKFVDGAVPYVDVTDPNPPASFLFFAPAIALARALHVAAEPVAAGFVFALVLMSIAACALIFRFGAKRSREDWGLALNAAVFLLALAPENVFAEREHIGLLFLAPILATLAVVGEGGRAPRWLRVLAGAGAGVSICFKPFFALAIAAPALAIAWRSRTLRLLVSAELVSAAVICVVYAFATMRLFPGYVQYALPVVADVYQPSRIGFDLLATQSLAPFNIVLLIALAAGAARGFSPPAVASGFVAPPATWVCAYASIGFLISFFLQGKGWINHAYPGLALALLAWVFFALDRHPRAIAARDGKLFKFVFLPAFIAAPMIFGAVRVLTNAEEHPGLRAEIARVASPNPRVIAMARQLDFGHPVTRQLHGSWVGRPNALFTASFAAYLLGQEKDPAYRARLEDYRRRDLAGFAKDVQDGRPDVIIVEDKDTREWVLKQPESAASLDDFVKTGRVDEIELWTRKAQ